MQVLGCAPGKVDCAQKRPQAKFPDWPCQHCQVPNVDGQEKSQPRCWSMHVSVRMLLLVVRMLMTLILFRRGTPNINPQIVGTAENKDPNKLPLMSETPHMVSGPVPSLSPKP